MERAEADAVSLVDPVQPEAAVAPVIIAIHVGAGIQATPASASVIHDVSLSTMPIGPRIAPAAKLLRDGVTHTERASAGPRAINGRRADSARAPSAAPCRTCAGTARNPCAPGAVPADDADLETHFPDRQPASGVRHDACIGTNVAEGKECRVRQLRQPARTSPTPPGTRRTATGAPATDGRGRLATVCSLPAASTGPERTP